ncbi:MAG: hypothetical protein M1457_10310 [bacterium]|nr:hypothetical protein [bacterium]
MSEAAARYEGPAMRGIQYVVDDKGRKKSVVIDLVTHARLWEDFQDQVVAGARKKEPRESLAAVRRRLIAAGKLPRDG